MTFTEKKAEYEAFRAKIAPILLTALPSDYAACWEQRSILEGWAFTAREFAVDFESLYLAAKSTEHDTIVATGYPKSQALEYAKTRCAEFRKYHAKAQVAADTIKDRQIRLSQNLKLTDAR